MPGHIHQYHRVNIGKHKDYFVYACALPGCQHYLHSENQVVGKYSICWICGAKFVITRDVRGRVLKKPHCIKCTRKKDGEKQRKLRVHPDEVRAPIFEPDLEIEEIEDEQPQQSAGIVTLIDLLGEGPALEEDDDGD